MLYYAQIIVFTPRCCIFSELRWELARDLPWTCSEVSHTQVLRYLFQNAGYDKNVLSNVFVLVYALLCVFHT